MDSSLITITKILSSPFYREGHIPQRGYMTYSESHGQYVMGPIIEYRDVSL